MQVSLVNNLSFVVVVLLVLLWDKSFIFIDVKQDKHQKFAIICKMHALSFARSPSQLLSVYNVHLVTIAGTLNEE